jgi:hypothetical protein
LGGAQGAGEGLVYLILFNKNRYLINNKKYTSMAGIKNIEGLSTEDINRELSNGGKFIVYQYCVSIIVMTFKRSSEIYFVKAGDTLVKQSVGFTMLSFVLGWWGIPWGPIYTIGAIYTNLTGGKDVTQEVLSSINSNKSAS